MNPQLITALMTLAPIVFELMSRRLDIKEKEVQSAGINSDKKVTVMKARRVYVLDPKTGKEKVAYLCE